MRFVKLFFSFLFGRHPRIFDKNGQICHKLPSKKWQKWQSRYKNDPECNWRNHTGMRFKPEKKI